MKKLLALLAIFGLVFVSCSDDDEGAIIPDPVPPTVDYTAGSANFSNYVAVGNSLTAGFSDNALFVDGQTASFPNMLASNFALVGGGDFKIPFMADNLGGAFLQGEVVRTNRLILSFLSGSPSPVPVEGVGTTDIANVLSGPFNNMGVPGARSYHLVAPGYGNVDGVLPGLANPFFARFASSPGTTVLADALAQNPTFFTLWIGSNDVLGYATAGGAGADHNVTGILDPTMYGGTDLTNSLVFAGALDGIIQALKSTGADGVIANIPDVTAIPFFTTVPHNPVPLDAATAAVLNEAYDQYNMGLLGLQAINQISAEEVQRRTISFAAGDTNAVVLLDEDLTDLTGFNDALTNMRQATEDDLLVLTSRSFIGSLADPGNPTSINGVAIPLADQWVLTPEEQQAIATAITAINQTITALAVQYDLALVDANAYLNEIAETGAPLNDGSTVTSTFGTGGGFSLDGVHPSPRGYALLANLFVEAINAKYGSNLPGVEPLDYTGLYID
ncbi:G-D-S-L family lipolytic protein [Spongiimicrobium sp. 3-5]|uniref:G-D-S-L family lipolytic protein n=1 Tax=Spongiimicrobium sp. 3-5 TaxID=3332596 RepID=UPI00397E9AF9